MDVFLDEPSSSLDPAARRVLWSWLRENKTNRTLLISSHLLDEVEELCDSVLIMDSGKIRAQGTVLELKRQFGPPGDRLHLEEIPAYVPKEWIINEETHFIQIPDRKQLISLLDKLDRDRIKYSLENITLDDIFIKLTSANESSSADENRVDSQINALFEARTSTNRTDLWSQQILGVLIRRGEVFLRRARLLPLVLLLYLAFALAPLYMPSFVPQSTLSTEHIRYIISSPPEVIKTLRMKNLHVKFTPSFYSAGELEKYLLSKCMIHSNRSTLLSEQRLPPGHRIIFVRKNSSVFAFRLPTVLNVSFHLPLFPISLLPVYLSTAYYPIEH